MRETAVLGQVTGTDPSTGKIKMQGPNGASQVDPANLTTNAQGQTTLKVPPNGTNIVAGEELADGPTDVAATKDSGDPLNGESIIQKLQHDPSSLSDEEIEWLQKHLAGGEHPEHGIHAETDPDLIGSGENGDVGNDATDSLINQVRDKDFERHARGGGSGNQSTLSENDELYKWLTIAGIR